MLSHRNKILAFVLSFCFLLVITFKVHASPDTSQKVDVNIEFLSSMSGGNKFLFNVTLKEDIEGTIKEFFIEDGEKILPVSTYNLSKNNYVIVVQSNNKTFSLKNVKLGVTLVVNRSEKNVKNIGTLNGKNESFKSGQLVSEPLLLYHDQDKIMIAMQIDDPWDTLKNVQAVLVYPEVNKNFEVSFEKKYVVTSGKLKQFVYMSMKGFEPDEVLKFNINLFFQNELNNVALRNVSTTFYYNFDKNEITENFVKLVYTTLLQREPTKSELSKSTKNLLNQEISSTEFILSVVDGNEFQNISINNKEFINLIYKIILNRTPDKDGLNYWMDQIKKSSRRDVLKQMLKSDEYIRRMKEIGLLP